MPKSGKRTIRWGKVLLWVACLAPLFRLTWRAWNEYSVATGGKSLLWFGSGFWSQAKERRLGEFSKRDTLMFNGYGDQVAKLYAGMDLKKYY